MFSKSQEEYLLRRLNRNEVVLFLGAGFSVDAVNHNDDNFPVGKQLTIKIWEFMFSGEPYIDDGTSLQDMYQAFLKSGKTFDQISNFLKENLTVKSYQDYYKYLTLAYWFKIYTVNVDNLLDKIYPRWSDQENINISFPNGSYKERDQLLDYLQIIYLHGKLPCKPDELIFSRAQYASSSVKLQPLYFHFIQDYSTLPTVFIGTSLDEQLFDQYIATRQSIRNGVPENRPKSFLITRSFSPIREKVLKDDYNIEVIKGTTKDFLEWLESSSDKLLSKDEILKTLLPSFNTLQQNSRFDDRYVRSVKEFAQAFTKIELTTKYPSKKKNYLLGSTPSWADINYNLDAPRKITVDLNKRIESLFTDDSDLHCIAILGSAGSGKSTVLKRLSLNLVSSGRTVFYSNSENLPRIGDVAETLDMLNERVIFSIDNAELVLKDMVAMAEELNKIKKPPIFVIASRTNVFDRISSRYEPIINLEEYVMQNLDREEIVEIIKKLDENNLLGHLKGLPQSSRIKEFENKAKKQILIAMRETTQGEDFDVIMKSEFNEIASEEGKLLCLCTSLTTDAGFTIGKQDFISFSSKPPSEALDLLERNLKDLVLKVGPKQDKLLIRHRTIAEYFIENCTSIEMRKQAYIRVLSSLASELNAGTKNTRKFTLYIEIINHYMIYKRFMKNIDKAREVYETLADYFRNDYHFWLQYGSLELEGVGGDLELAENYLNQAASLKSSSTYVKNALAQLSYKKALLTSNPIVANDLKDYADGVMFELLRDRLTNDPYTYHIYGRGNYNWILKWVSGREPVKRALQNLEKILKEGCELYPSNRRLQDLKTVIFKAILMTAVNNDIITYPVLYSEFEG